MNNKYNEIFEVKFNKNTKSYEIHPFMDDSLVSDYTRNLLKTQNVGKTLRDLGLSDRWGDYSAELSIYEILNKREKEEVKKIVIPAVYNDGINGVAPVTKIASYAFYGVGLHEIILPDTISEIGRFSFSKNKLTSITLPSNIENVEVNSFSENKITSINIPNAVKHIEYLAFFDNPLKNITLNEGLESIGFDAFGDMSMLEKINIPLTVMWIPEDLFDNASDVAKKEYEKWKEVEDMRNFVLAR